jgi:hypothetical protein
LFASCGEIQIRDWAPYSGVSNISSANNILSFTSTSQMPLLMSSNDLFINANKLKIIIMNMRSDKSYLTGRLFFKRIGDKDFNYFNSFEFQTGINNSFKTYIINTERNPNWLGVITQLMFSPVNEKGSIALGSFSLSEPSLWLKISSFWQEFWTFERPVPRSINLIYAPKINGTSINLYVYYSVYILLIVSFVYYILRCFDIKHVINNVFSKAILICFIFWVLLDARILLDQVRYAVLNYQIFGGKSLEEKQAFSTFQNFYDYYYFLKICKAKLPERASYSLILPDGYIYCDVKARYYLYPIYEAMKPGEVSDYIIVYGPKELLKGKNVSPQGYKLFARCNNIGYILKRSTTP